MIIAEKKPGFSFRPLAIAVLLLLISLLLFAVLLPQQEARPIREAIADNAAYFCSAEVAENDFFISNGTRFSRGSTQTSEIAYSGKHSCKVETGEGIQYGFGLDLKDAQPGDIFQVSVWRHRPYGGREGHLVASGEGDGKFYITEYTPTKTDGEWELLELSFSVPIQKEVKDVKVYVFTDGKIKMYFDDLKVVKLRNLMANEDFVPKQINLEFGPKAMQKIKGKQMDAFRNGLLVSADDDWVKGSIIDGKEAKTKVSARLKGDWLDHLNSNKLSFRIKTRQDAAWNRMKVFSIHTPKARSFLREWLLHRLFEKEDILTPRYDFATVTLNGQPKGVYAVEEHFDKILLEYKHRREGPIIKFTEDGFWEGINRQLKQIDGLDHDIEQSVMEAETADIKPFKETTTLKSPVLKKQFELAHNLLNQYRYGLKSASEVFDLDVLARYYAIGDLMGAYHGLSWHNQRFYYDPVSSRIEPIGYDGFGEVASKRSYLMGQGALNRRIIDMETLDKKLFMEPDFAEKYVAYLWKYSSRSYVSTFLAEIQEELMLREALIRQEFSSYKFNQEDFIDNCQRVNLMILPYNNTSLKAYSQSATGETRTLKVASTHSLPLEVIGYGTRLDQMRDTLLRPLLLDSYVPRLFKQILDEHGPHSINTDTFTGALIWEAYRSQDFIDFVDLEVPASARYLFFKPLGIDSVFHQEISSWKAPFEETPAQELMADYALNNQGWFDKSEKMIYFRKGKHRIDQPVVIPEGYRVYFEAGAEIDFVKQALFLSYSPIFSYGNEEEPVKIFSSDHSARGFTVINAVGESKMFATHFEHFNTLDYKGWTLTGAVTFYESNVEIKKCLFTKNHCEDALNVIRSEFSLTSSVVSETFADGLDADFCKLYIDNCRFIRTGNDGLDLSGSVGIMANISTLDCGDKGISIGEESDISLLSAEIDGSPIALAAKDLSVLLIDKITMRNCTQGFTAYRKKSEYGGGTIIVKAYQADNIKRLHNIRQNSRLQLMDKLIEED